MRYTTRQVSRMAGITPRALRYWDQIGLLKPCALTDGGYRLYGPAEIDALQQILFYRELGFDLESIRNIVADPGFDRGRALEGHLAALEQRQERLDRLIENVRRTLASHRGGEVMSDEQKFEGFKRKMVDENEARYGAQARELYGDQAVDASNEKLLGMSQEQARELEAVGQELARALKRAVEARDTSGTNAKALFELHKRWLMFFWKTYDPRAHAGLAQMYVDDERFAAYYEAIAPGGAAILRDVIVRFAADGAR